MADTHESGIRGRRARRRPDRRVAPPRVRPASDRHRRGPRAGPPAGAGSPPRGGRSRRRGWIVVIVGGALLLEACVVDPVTLSPRDERRRTTNRSKGRAALRTLAART